MLLKYFASLLLSPLHWIVMYIVTSAKLLLFLFFVCLKDMRFFSGSIFYRIERATCLFCLRNFRLCQLYYCFRNFLVFYICEMKQGG